MVEVGKSYILKIEKYNNKGEGIGYIDEFVVFVPSAIVDEIVEVKIEKVNKTYGYGKIKDILSISNSRVTPICNIYKNCGGCDLQHMDYKEQINFKESKIKDAFERIGNIKNIKIDRFYSMENPYKYRNKVQVPFSEVDGIVVSGFYKNKTHKIIDMDFCHIQFPEANDIIRSTKEYLKHNNIRSYDGVRHFEGKKDYGLFRHLLIRKGYNTGEIMVVVILTQDNKEFLEEYTKFLLSKFKSIKTIVLNINNKVTNVILGEEERILFGDGYIKDKINNLTFRIQSKSFFQVNTKQSEKLYLAAMDMAELKYGDVLLDAYCGIGTIGMCASRRVRKVYGIEEVEQSIRDANENKIINNIKNIEFVQGKVEDVIDTVIKGEDRITAAIIDPPRKGVKENVLHKLREINCKKIVYISCDVATLARDSKILLNLGYTITKVCGVDMFCQTSHIETIACFKLKK